MTIQEVALRMWPAWTMGLIMLYLVKNSKYSYLLRVNKKGLLKFACWMSVVTLVRFVLFKLSGPASAQARELANFLPWQVTLAVFWEDMCHGVPLVLAGLMLKSKSWYKYVRLPLLLMVMFSFASGHVYQGMFAAATISFYIPFTMSLGKKYGFGTVMLCHMFYDLLTILSFKWMLGS